MAFPEDTGMTKDQKIIRAKVGLLELARQLGNVSQACKMMGDSRDSFYRFKDLYEAGGELALRELTRRKPILKNRVDPALEVELVEVSLAWPTCGNPEHHEYELYLAVEDIDHSRTKTK